MKLINLLSKPVRILTFQGEVTIPPSGQDVRFRVERVPRGEVKVDGKEIPIQRTVVQDLEGLPEPQPDVYLIVPGILVGTLPREDLVSPDDYVRDQQGRILGCRGLRAGAVTQDEAAVIPRRGRRAG